MFSDLCAAHDLTSKDTLWAQAANLSEQSDQVLLPFSSWRTTRRLESAKSEAGKREAAKGRPHARGAVGRAPCEVCLLAHSTRKHRPTGWISTPMCEITPCAMYANIPFNAWSNAPRDGGNNVTARSNVWHGGWQSQCVKQCPARCSLVGVTDGQLPHQSLQGGVILWKHHR